MKESIQKSGNITPQVLSFKSQSDWRDWLEKNSETTNIGIWLRLYKKKSGVKSLNYKEALDEALCFGWIDGQVKSLDELSFIQKFTPRRARSIWSKRNTENVARLITEGKMRPQGLKQVEAAKADGRWQLAYDPPSDMKAPEDFLKELSKDKEAQAFYESLSKTNKFAIAWRLQTAKKAETRESRMRTILEMMKRKEKLL